VKPLRIVVIDDHIMIREGLSALLRGAGHNVVGEGRSGEDALGLSEQLRPDFVILDVSLEGMNGVEAVKKMTATEGHRPAVIMLSMHKTSDTVERALKAGARGYVLKGGDFRELTNAMEMIQRGETYVAGGLTTRSSPEVDDASADDRPLTAREDEILRLVADGYSSKQIAAQLGLSPRTVDNHRANMMQKLRIQSTAGLVRYFFASRK
jgi:DNA-binding NarL/FixJ family response regulator